MVRIHQSPTALWIGPKSVSLAVLFPMINACKTRHVSLLTLQGERIILSCTNSRLFIHPQPSPDTPQKTVSYMVQTLSWARASPFLGLCFFNFAKSSRKAWFWLPIPQLGRNLYRQTSINYGAVRTGTSSPPLDRSLDIFKLFMLYLVSSNLCKSWLLRNR